MKRFKRINKTAILVYDGEHWHGGIFMRRHGDWESSDTLSVPARSLKQIPAELLDWLRAAQLDRVGCFQYSPVEGARANALDGHVPDEIKQERWERFMAVQAEISAERLQRRVGGVETVLVDEVADDHAIARSRSDAPEIDGQVIISGGDSLEPGDLVQVVIDGADQYDLFAHSANRAELSASAPI